MSRKRLSLLLGACLVVGCTTLGRHDPGVLAAMDFGPRQTIRFCVLRDEGIAEAQVGAVMAAISAELERYGLEVRLSWTRDWTRASPSYRKLIDEVASHPLEAPCDRLLALAARPAANELWGILVHGFGAAEIDTSTHAYVFVPVPAGDGLGPDPGAVAVHETYHLLGCRHDRVMTSCYRRIVGIKQAARANAKAGRDFFPGFSLAGEVVPSRAAVNALLEQALKGLTPGAAEGDKAP